MLLPSVQIACSGPGVIEAIVESVRLGYLHAAFAVLVSAGLLLWHWRRGGLPWMALPAGLLLVHPAWTVSVMGGDCGYARRAWSLYFSVAFAVLLAVQLYARRPHPRGA